MVIFPKSITEQIWSNHLRFYSRTLPGYYEKYQHLLSKDAVHCPHENIYICPLCASNYFAVNDKKNIYGNSEFSLDHLPPESVGGKFKILTCKKCNNDSGLYEAELLRLLDFASVPDRRNGSILPKMWIVNTQTGQKFPGLVRFANGTKNITFNQNAKEYNKELKIFLDDLHDGKLPRLQILVASPDLSKIEKALLKSAYLICFIWWGYEFVFSENGERIRKVLRSELSYPTTVPTSWHETSKGVLPKGVGIVSRNGIKQFFYVGLEISTSTESCMAAVVIPNPTENGWDDLTKLGTAIKAKQLTEFECLTIPRTRQHQGYTVAWNTNWNSQ